MTINRRTAIASLAAGAALLRGAGAGPAAAQDANTPVKIGYVISLTGPNTGGAGTTILPNYQLWAHELREKGGLLVGDTRRPIAVIEYDVRSNSEDAVRAVERLINQDQVDILLAPWGTALNLRSARSLTGMAISCPRRPRSPTARRN